MWRRWFEQQWQHKSGAQSLLLPLSWLFASLSALRRTLYRVGIFSSTKLPVNVIVVGNISVGGVGKTPLVIYLADALRAAGYHPGILSRGYGGQQTGEVSPTSDPVQYGDEPVLIAQRTKCPVWVHPLRAKSGLALLNAHPETDILICDDGLQHYALQRDIEIVVVQRPYGLGNGRLLPAGPLREPLSRLLDVDIIVETGQLPDVSGIQPCFQQTLHAGQWTAADYSSRISVEALQQESLLAIAGIGNPQRFFNTLSAAGLVFEKRVFADHYEYSKQDFEDTTGKTILMTEKDAVKCRHLDLANAWYLPVTATVSPVGHQQTLPDCVISLLEKRKGNIK